MIGAHLKSLRLRDVLDSEEEAAIRAAISTIIRVPANSVLTRAGEPLDRALLVLCGWVAQSKQLPGYERQVTAISLPGDVADLHGLILGRLDHDVTALTDCTFAVLPHERLRGLFRRHRRLELLYNRIIAIDAAIGREWATSLGRRSRASHMAHLFCEIFIRLGIVARTAGNSVDFPLTQTQLAECVGATPVHVNRVLQELRSAGLVRLEQRRLTILDPDGLRELARFDPDYLYLDRMDAESPSLIAADVSSVSPVIPRRSAVFAEAHA